MNLNKDFSKNSLPVLASILLGVGFSQTIATGNYIVDIIAISIFSVGCFALLTTLGEIFVKDEESDK